MRLLRVLRHGGRRPRQDGSATGPAGVIGRSERGSRQWGRGGTRGRRQGAWRNTSRGGVASYRGRVGQCGPACTSGSIRSAAAYGSRWHWKADPAEGARVRAAIGSSLLEALAEEEDERVVVAVVEALSAVATPQLAAGLLERIQATDANAARSPTDATERFRRALDRVNRTLARQQGRRDRAR